MLDIRRVSLLADYFVICSGDSERQVRAIADDILEKVKKEVGFVPLNVEGVPEIADTATSVRRELGRDGSREEVLAALLNAFEARYTDAQGSDAAFRAWRSRLETLGRRVRATLGERVEEGVAEDVDAQGSLLIRRDDGSLVTVEAGDVTLRA